MGALLELFSPLADVLVERMAERVRQLQDEAVPKFYSRKEVASLLHVSLPTVHAMMNAGALKSEKIGARVLFPAAAVDEQIRSGQLRKGSWSKQKGGVLL